MSNKNIRKAFIKDFKIKLRFKHDETMPDIVHLQETFGQLEDVSFNFEIGYIYKPVTQNSSIDEVFEYTFICRHLTALQDHVHTCIIENLLESVTDKILENKKVLYVKCDILRHQISPHGTIGVGVEKYQENQG